MSDTAKSKELLTRYSIARIPFIAINTIEPGRTLEMLKEISEEFAASVSCTYADKGSL